MFKAAETQLVKSLKVSKLWPLRDVDSLPGARWGLAFHLVARTAASSPLISHHPSHRLPTVTHFGLNPSFKPTCEVRYPFTCLFVGHRRAFSTCSPLLIRHWSDTLKDDRPEDRDLRDPLGTRARKNDPPHALEMEQEMAALRAAQEEKYSRLRLICVVYILAGFIGGVCIAESFRNIRKSQLGYPNWMTKKQGDLLKPNIQGAFVILCAFIIEIVESIGTFGAHIPIWTLSAALAGFAIRQIIGKLQELYEVYIGRQGDEEEVERRLKAVEERLKREREEEEAKKRQRERFP